MSPSRPAAHGADPAARVDSSPRRTELLDAAYAYVLRTGSTDLTLRPLAAAIGSSPRVLLFLFGSRDGLIRALLDRARADELRLLETVRSDEAPAGSAVATTVWQWLAAAQHRAVVTLWTSTYAKSLLDRRGPYAELAAASVRDWLAVFADLGVGRDDTDRTVLLAILRGALLDLLATGDHARVTAAVQRYLRD